MLPFFTKWSLFYVESKNLYKAVGNLYVTPFIPPTENHISFVVAIYELDSDNFFILIKSEKHWKTNLRKRSQSN